ncbi:MAG: nickel-dependent hydrogenase large subunit [Alphaproteobacteria bacterium]|nr:nickel-dependent hydrogenase large subunit [Alphaproteobacteria bacterium]
MTRLIVGPFNRVEGDLEIRLEIKDGLVQEAFATAPLFRDFEHLMEGRFPQDALVVAPRICGICSVAQSAASASALADCVGLVMPPNGRAVFNLLQALENAADHLVHFSLFFMPDFARHFYEGRPWHEKTVARFKAQQGEMARQAAAARTRLFAAMGILAGKWPHTLALQPGGSTKPLDLAERIRLLEIIGEFRRFLEGEIFAANLERVVVLATQGELDELKRGDFGLFLSIADDLDLWRLGRSPAPLMSCGAFPGLEGEAHLFASGLWRDGARQELDLARITEDASRSWLQGGQPLHPSQGTTQPEADKPDAYSWSKAPRLLGQSVEVGALARQVLAGQPLVKSMFAEFGSTVATRVAARLIELARLVLQMESWAGALDPRQPFCVPFAAIDVGQGVGLIEAARGTLGHWLTIEHGKLKNYQVIAPTTWNFSPRDGQHQPGPVEAALVGVRVEEGESSPLAVQHVVRSFDPCMACTVH